MNITNRMREKYARKPYGSMGNFKNKAGGEDVLKLCGIVDGLRSLLQDSMCYCPTDVQNDIQKELFFLESK